MTTERTLAGFLLALGLAVVWSVVADLHGLGTWTLDRWLGLTGTFFTSFSIVLLTDDA